MNISISAAKHEGLLESEKAGVLAPVFFYYTCLFALIIQVIYAFHTIDYNQERVLSFFCEVIFLAGLSSILVSP